MRTKYNFQRKNYPNANTVDPLAQAIQELGQQLGWAREEETGGETVEAAAGPTLIGLICNSVVLPGPLHPSPASMAAGMEEPEICCICDKSFKLHRTLDNHIKKQHGLSASPIAMTAGGESAALPTLLPKAEMETDESQKAMRVRSGQEGKREKVSVCVGAA